jgi:hypothetical protein
MSKKVKQNYRKIWEEYYKLKIPPGYHIHHIDGNRENNHPNNLMCLSPEDHHNLHLSRGDIVAKYGKFIQGASEAGRLGGSKSKPRWEEGDKKKRLSIGLKKSYDDRGGSSLKGKPITLDHKNKISASMRGKLNHMYGKTHTEEVRSKLSKIGKTKTGDKNNFYGKQHSLQSRKKMSDHAKTRTGSLNSMYGRSVVNEKKLRWYTNGTSVIYVTEGTQPTGYIRGRKLKI